MSNPLKGEVRLLAGGQSFVLVLGANAMVTLEAALDLSLSQIGALFQSDMRIGTLRTLLWAALQDRHPEVDELEAGRIMDEAGFEQVGEKIGEAFTLALPKEDAKGAARPPKPGKSGTGKKS